MANKRQDERTGREILIERVEKLKPVLPTKQYRTALFIAKHFYSENIPDVTLSNENIHFMSLNVGIQVCVDEKGRIRRMEIK